MQVTDDGMGKPVDALSILAGKVLPEPLIKVVGVKARIALREALSFSAQQILVQR
jgi:hypothetical protein